MDITNWLHQGIWGIMIVMLRWCGLGDLFDLFKFQGWKWYEMLRITRLALISALFIFAQFTECQLLSILWNEFSLGRQELSWTCNYGSSSRRDPRDDSRSKYFTCTSTNSSLSLFFLEQYQFILNIQLCVCVRQPSSHSQHCYSQRTFIPYILSFSS